MRQGGAAQRPGLHGAARGHPIAKPGEPAKAAAVRAARADGDAIGATAGEERSFLAFDFGARRVGVACGNCLTRTATPLASVAAQGAARFAAIGRLIEQWRPDALVVGIPRHPDGTPNENTERTERFARQLHGRFRLPVHRVDERYSTVEACSLGATDLDAAAAALILEQHMRERP